VALAKIHLPSKLTKMEAFAFGDCKSLVEIKFTEKSELVELGEQAFEGCSSWVQVTLPPTLIEMGFVFKDCTSLIRVTMPNGDVKVPLDRLSLATKKTT